MKNTEILLEWSTSSPPPFYNFAITPVVHTRDAWWHEKEERLKGVMPAAPHYEDIHMPKNTPVGFIIAVFSGLFGFGIIWHISWMIPLGLIGMIVCVVKRVFNNHIDYYVPVAEVETIENENLNRKKQS